MKRLCLLLTFLALLLTACGKKDLPAVSTVEPTQLSTSDSTQASYTEQETDPVPPMLIGAWRSLDPGELDMVETIEFFEDGSISVNCTYQGEDAGTIYGTYVIINGVLHCDMTSNGEPYILDYQYIIDGRELVLSNDSNEANYIKVS